MTAVGRRTIIPILNFWEFWCWERCNKNNVLPSFLQHEELKQCTGVKKTYFCKGCDLSHSFKILLGCFYCFNFSFKVPSGTHDYSDGFLKNVTIYSGSLSRPGQIRPDSSVQPPKPHVQLCIHPFTFWKLCRGCCKAAVPVCWVVCNVILQKRK